MNRNDECIELILHLNDLCSSLVTDITMAENIGLKNHNFSEQDLKDLKKIHDHFCKAYDEIPVFEYIAKFDKEIEY